MLIDRCRSQISSISWLFENYQFDREDIVDQSTLSSKNKYFQVENYIVLRVVD
jgi:hypothetical protein